MNVFRKILHYKDSKADKVYIVDVNHIENNYIVSATWGKREQLHLNSQIKGTFGSKWTAEALAIKLVRDKYGGRTKYKDAQTGLDIKGLKPLNLVNVAKIEMSNRKPTVSSVSLDTREKLLRKIKL